MSRKIPAATSSIPTSSSPVGGQRSIQTLLYQEKEREKEKEKEREKEREKEKSKEMEAMLQTIVQGIRNLEAKTDEIQKNTQKTDEKVDNIQQMMQQYEKKFKKIEEENVFRDKKTEEIDARLEVVEKDKSSLGWEMDKAEFYLRFQNVEEEKGEDLVDLMANILAEALEITIEKMKDGMDDTFRVFTRFATRNKLPREVHIRFTKRTIKTQILQALRDKTLKYKEKEIKVLKQIPKRIRDIRREYRFLTRELLKRGINYRWLVPEGLIFTWQEKRQRIDSLEKAEYFVMEFFRGGEEVRTRDQPPAANQEEDLLIEMEKEEGAVGGAPREQREIRTTRAINPSYKI